MSGARRAVAALILTGCGLDVAPEPTPPAASVVAGPAALAPSVESAPSAAAAPSAPVAPASSVAPPTPSAEPKPDERGARPVGSVAPRGSVVVAVASALPIPTSAPSASIAPVASVAPPVVRRRGPAATGESYEVALETTGGYSVGAPSAVVVVLSAKPPFKCNAQYPYKFSLDAPPPGLAYDSAVVRGMQVDGKHASLSVPFTPSRPGAFSVSGTLSFSTCSVERCLVDKAHLSVIVDVR